MIRHAHLIAVDRVRNRNRRMIHAADLRILQVLPDDFGDTRIVRARIDMHGRDLARAGLERETRIGAADVGQ